MQRDVGKSLLSWKNRANRKPLVLMGARQVGKTWLMREFGKRNFARVHEFNFDEQKGLAGFFRDTKEPKDILPKLAALSGARIDVDADVVVFDEIQECPEALNALKYFRERCPRLAILAAGSLLGVRLGRKRRGAAEASGDVAADSVRSYPVGQVELLDVEPLDFSEFLRARDPALHGFYETVSGTEPLPEVFHRKLLDAYDAYLFTGGMPEVVADHLERGDPRSTRKLQRDLIALQEDDVVKYNGEIDAAKILVVLRALVPQLAKERPSSGSSPRGWSGASTTSRP